jgi:hypothetical protein
MSSFMGTIVISLVITIPAYLIALGILKLCKRWFGDGVHNFLRRTVNIVFSLLALFWLLGAYLQGDEAVKKEEEAAIQEAKEKANDEFIENVMSEADIVIFCPVPKVIEANKGTAREFKYVGDQGDSYNKYEKGDLWGTEEFYLIPNKDDIEKSLLVKINTDNGDSVFSFDMIRERSEQILGVDGFALNRTSLIMRAQKRHYKSTSASKYGLEEGFQVTFSTEVRTQCERINGTITVAEGAGQELFESRERKKDIRKRKFRKI